MDRSVQLLKNDVRKLLKSRLGNLPVNYRKSCSDEIFRRVEQMPAYERCRAVFCYLSMPQEVQTMNFIEKCFDNGKRVFVPKVTGRKSNDMQVLEATSMDEIKSYPKNSWGIPEPPTGNEFWTGKAFAAIDFILIPGVGFDSSCQRLGHGKGYYDNFLSMCQNFCDEEGKARPFYVGVSFEEQIVDDIPTSSNDVPLDFIVTPSQLYCRGEYDALPSIFSAESLVGSKNKVEADEVERESNGSASGGDQNKAKRRVFKKNGWTNAFMEATKIGNEGESHVIGFAPGRDGEPKAEDFGGFRQPNTLASFVSSHSDST